MKKTFTLSLLFTIYAGIGHSQISEKLAPYAEEYTLNAANQLNFIRIKDSKQVNEAEVANFINNLVLNNSSNKVVVFKTEKDELGFTHTKYNLVQNSYPVFSKLIIAHCQAGKLVSLNGDLAEIKEPANKFTITEKNALKFALKKINAKKYKWQNKAEEAHMRATLNQPNFSYYPTGEKVIIEKAGKYYFAYRFNIYAEVPLYRANVFVDAASGKILAEQSLICNVDVSGSANTKYSGTQTITCDQNVSVYRLRESQRGLGIETYNLNYTSNYANTDFTNTATTWTTLGANQAAEDAHWGAEKTYDYYFTRFNRNSIDNAGYKLLSYLHYNTNYNNAFWDGTRMTYGDGNGTTFTTLTALDVCGHEITHGLVSNTAMLNGGGTGEADALNEAFADIFGTSIERFARPSNWNWKMGSDITINGNGIRNMQTPKTLSDPDTYLGQYWDAAGEPHNNAGPCIKWFYLLVAGGTGTNDINSAYTVSGLGNIDAEKIAYRALTTYFTPGTTYANARTYAIQAAKDLFGNCSNQVTQTANAWYAVGVGSQFVPGLIAPNFTAPNSSYCSMPVTVSFNNTTANGLSYTWNFGDGTTSTSTNAVHTYTANGTYNVKLKAIGCTGSDSITKNSFIVINAPAQPVASNTVACLNNAVTLSASGNSLLKWYASLTSSVVLGTGASYLTPPLTANSIYYVASTYSNASSTGGKTTITGGAYLNNAAQWLVFDVLQGSLLNSVQVDAQTAGNRTIELRDALGNVLNSITANLAVGANTVALNFYMNPGTNYQLGLGNASASSLYRSNTGVTYPYNVGGCANITGSSAGNTYYYWFYNWRVTKGDCSSQRVPVTVSVAPATPISITAPATFVCVDNEPLVVNAGPAGGTLSGAGLSGNTFNPMTGAGTYVIKYSYTNANGCVSNDSLQIIVDMCTGIAALKQTGESISVYPNPGKNNVVLKNALINHQTHLILSDASGRFIFEKEILSNEEAINLTSVANGLYFLSVKDKSGNLVKTVKLLKE